MLAFIWLQYTMFKRPMSNVQLKTVCKLLFSVHNERGTDNKCSRNYAIHDFHAMKQLEVHAASLYFQGHVLDLKIRKRPGLKNEFPC
jgi:hypothetical protein